MTLDDLRVMVLHEAQLISRKDSSNIQSRLTESSCCEVSCRLTQGLDYETHVVSAVRRSSLWLMPTLTLVLLLTSIGFQATAIDLPKLKACFHTLSSATTTYPLFRSHTAPRATDDSITW